MRPALAICLLSIILLGCVTRAERDAQNAERDHNVCVSMGIGSSHPSYSNCRFRAAQMRIAERQSNEQKGLRLMGIGAGILSNP